MLHMQVAASARPEPLVDVHDTYDGSDEEIERQAPATESAPRGARRFSEKYSDNKAQVILPACCGVIDHSRPVHLGSCQRTIAHCQLWKAVLPMPWLSGVQPGTGNT